jgi:hypothetical protein
VERRREFQRSHTKDYMESFTFFEPETAFGNLER